MDRRPLRLLVLGFSCLWFGALMPVHQRGQIRLPGPVVSIDADGSQLPKARCHRGGPDAKCHGRQERQPDPGKESPGPGNCAVCHFIAGLDAPPPVVVGIMPMRLLRVLPPEQAPAAPPRHAALPFHGLDPPLA